MLFSTKVKHSPLGSWLNLWYLDQRSLNMSVGRRPLTALKMGTMPIFNLQRSNCTELTNHIRVMQGGLQEDSGNHPSGTDSMTEYNQILQK